ncbi:MAG: hypothetical protein AB7O59_07690 [Pirellulales bacterium]
MIGRLSLWVAVAVLLAMSVGASKADAQFISGGGYGLGFFNYGDNSYMFQRPPYFALYPPVYYSYPVARTYGYSPFAYPPGVMTPELRPSAKSATYTNPFVPKGNEASPAADKAVSNTGPPVRVAQTYINPFVSSTASPSHQALTARVEP